MRSNLLTILITSLLVVDFLNVQTIYAELTEDTDDSESILDDSGPPETTEPKDQNKRLEECKENLESLNELQSTNQQNSLPIPTDGRIGSHVLISLEVPKKYDTNTNSGSTIINISYQVVNLIKRNVYYFFYGSYPDDKNNNYSPENRKPNDTQTSNTVGEPSTTTEAASKSKIPETTTTSKTPSRRSYRGPRS